jgi:hypothetical protein
MTKRIHKGLVSLVATAILASFLLPLSTSAANLTRTYAGPFNTNFEATVWSDNYTALLIYGFNTFAVDEDYALLDHYTASHYVCITNGAGVFCSPVKEPDITASVEVPHSGSSVTYSCYW